MALIKAPQVWIVVVAALRLVRFPLLKKCATIWSKRGTNGLQPLFATALATPREDDFVETVDQSIRSLLILQPVKGQGLAAKPMDTHHPFDKHLRQVIEHLRVLQIDPCRSQGVPFRRSHLLHASGVETPRFESELSQLHLGKKRVHGCGWPLQAEPLLTIQQIPQMRQRGASRMGSGRRGVGAMDLHQNERLRKRNIVGSPLRSHAVFSTLATFLFIREALPAEKSI